MWEPNSLQVNEQPLPQSCRVHFHCNHSLTNCGYYHAILNLKQSFASHHAISQTPDFNENTWMTSVPKSIPFYLSTNFLTSWPLYNYYSNGYCDY